MSRITLITPTKNRSLPIIARCIDSVNGQTLGGWQHLVCTDGPREPAVDEFISSRREPRRKYLALSQPVGHYGAGVRAVLLPYVTTEFVGFLDDDNFLFPHFCERMVKALDDDAQAGFAICRIVHCGPLVPELGPPPQILTGVPPVVNHIDALQVVVRTAVMQASGWVLSGYTSDGATYVRLAQSYKYVAVNEVLAIHT